MEDQPANINYMYRNTHKKTGTAVIICNVVFKPFGGSQQSPRRDAIHDVERLIPLLHDLGFHVICHFNQSVNNMQRILTEIARGQQYHKDSDCFLCVLSSHGHWLKTGSDPNKGGLLDVIYGSDGRIASIKQLVKQFHSSSSLDGKAKIFLLQCCRGSFYPTNVEMVRDSERRVLDDHADEPKIEEFEGSKIEQLGNKQIKHGDHPKDYTIPYDVPIKKDILLHYATPPGFVSFKKSSVGTPFLQAWCSCLESQPYSVDLLSMTTLVCAHVAETYTSFAPSKAHLGADNRKQMPQAVSMLTKDFYFRAKLPLDIPDVEVNGDPHMT